MQVTNPLTAVETLLSLAASIASPVALYLAWRTIRDSKRQSADRKEAVFVFADAHGGFPGFRTSDHRIIQSLEGLARRTIKRYAPKVLLDVNAFPALALTRDPTSLAARHR